MKYPSSGTMFFITVSTFVALWVIIHYFRWYHWQKDGLKKYIRSIKRTLLAPLYYFWGYTCDICGKEYLFNSHKAFIKEDGLTFSVTISKWTVYKYINDGVFLRLTNKSLPMGGKKKQKHDKVRPARVQRGTVSKSGRR